MTLQQATTQQEVPSNQFEGEEVVYTTPPLRGDVSQDAQEVGEDYTEGQQSEEEGETEQEETASSILTQLQEELGIDAATLKNTIEFIQTYGDDFQVLPFARQWGVDFGEASKRVDAVLDYIETLPSQEKERLQKDGTPDDIIQLWNQKVSKQRKLTNFGKSKSGSSSRVQAAAPTYLFTEEQIENMPEPERRAKDAQILSAYAQGKVKLRNWNT